MTNAGVKLAILTFLIFSTHAYCITTPPFATQSPSVKTTVLVAAGPLAGAVLAFRYDVEDFSRCVKTFKATEDGKASCSIKRGVNMSDSKLMTTVSAQKANLEKVIGSDEEQISTSVIATSQGYDVQAQLSNQPNKETITSKMLMDSVKEIFRIIPENQLYITIQYIVVQKSKQTEEQE